MEIFMSYKLRQVMSLRVLNEVSLDTTDIASVVCVCVALFRIRRQGFPFVLYTSNHLSSWVCSSFREQPIQ